MELFKNPITSLACTVVRSLTPSTTQVRRIHWLLTLASMLIIEDYQFRPIPHMYQKPAEALAFRVAATVMQGGGEGSTVPKGVNPGGIKNWGFDANVIFPNMVISAANGWCLTQTYMPESVDRTYWEINLHMPRAVSLAEKVAQSYSANLIRDVLMMEDATTLERTFRGLISGGLRHFLFSDQEIACRHQFEVVDAIVNASDEPT